MQIGYRIDYLERKIFTANRYVRYFGLNKQQ